MASRQNGFQIKLTRVSDGREFRLSTPAVIGRKRGDLVLTDDVRLSSSHLKMAVDAEGRIFIEDLKSANGTTVNKTRLTPGSRTRLEPGSRVHFGSHDYTVDVERNVQGEAVDPRPWRLVVFPLVFSVFPVICYIMNPALWQLLTRTHPVSGLALVASLLFSGIVVSAVFAVFQFLENRWWQMALKLGLGYFATLGLHIGVVMLQQPLVPAGPAFVQSVIEVSCLERFDHKTCVDAINLCPSCALRIDKWRRVQIEERLKATREYYPKSANPREPASPAAN